MKQFYFFLIVFISIQSNLYSFSGEGSGTKAAPYQITNVEQLQEMNDGLEAHYILMNDIDASETKDWNEGRGFFRIGDFKAQFEGSLDGQNHAIDEIFITPFEGDPSYFTGLIGINGKNGIIKNISMKSCFVASPYENVGTICGSNEGRIINCSSSGYVFGHSVVGGLCGINTNGGIIENSYSFCNVKSYIGGGGFCGRNDNGSLITKCYASGDVEGDNIGGFCQWNEDAIISECFATGNVTGTLLTEGVAGFCGINFTDGVISDCFATGDVYGAESIGGFCSSSYRSAFKRCYASGNVKATGRWYIDDFIGWVGDSTTIESVFALNDTTGKNRSTFEDADWDFDTTWCILEGVSYPQLQWFADCATSSVDDNEYSSDELSIYPNPTEGRLAISLDNNTPIESINIYSIYGQAVGEYNNINSDNILINLNLPQGIYFTEVIAGRKKYAGKFVVGR